MRMRHAACGMRHAACGMRHADAACGMRQQMAIVGTHRIDPICADAACGADTDAAN